MAGEIFISYRRADEAWARLLHAQLQAEGAEAWYDAQIGAGQDWRNATAKALQASRIFVLLFSAAAAESEDIAKELAAAIFSKKLVVPVRIEDIQPTGAFLYELASRNWVNAFENTEAKLAELAKGLAKLVRDGIVDESIIPFDRNAGANAPARKSGRPARKTWVIAAAALLIIAAGGAATLLVRPAPPTEFRIAMLPFDVLSDDKNQNFFAAGLVDEIGGVLAKNQLQTISRSQVIALPAADREAALAKLGVTFYLGGAVQSDGQTTHVTVHLDDASGHVTIWTEEFSRPVKDASALEGEVAAATTFAVLGLLDTARHTNGEVGVQLMAGLLRTNDLINNNDYQEARRAAQQLMTQAPDLAPVHARLALATLGVARQGPADQAPALLAEAKSEAERAVQLNPNLGEAYLALVYLTPSTDWQGREALLTKGIAVDTSWPFLPYHVSKHLWSVGRLKDALPVDARGLALMPFHLGLNAQRTIELASLGRLREAKESVDRVVTLWPTEPRTRPLQLWFAVFFRAPEEALALLDNADQRPADLEPVTVAAWRDFIKARPSHDTAAKTKVERTVTDLADNHEFDRANAVQILAMLGDVDGAFAQMTKYVDETGGYHRGMLVLPPAILFYPTTAAMRRDPRFMPLAAKLGLVSYWRATGKWPDFCSEPGLPYDCRKEAERSTAAK
jgi:TolB-like protein/tetratricopeptide (TPR) repeat protein